MLAGLLGGLAFTCQVFAADGPASDGASVAGKVGSKEITVADLDQYVGREAYDLKLRLYNLRKRALDSIIESMLVDAEAQREHVTRKDIIGRALNDGKASESVEADRIWAEDFDALAPLGEVMGHFRAALDIADTAKIAALQRLLNDLRTVVGVQVSLEPPKEGMQFHPTGLAIGPDRPAAELTVFFDYDCPYCKKLEEELAGFIGTEEGRTLRVVYKQFPLSIHATAFNASVAAVCASRQDHFEPMHRALISAPEHSPKALAEIGRSIGLDPAQFQACLQSEESKIQVGHEIEEGKRSGVQGTPSVFLNGKPFDVPASPDELRARLAAAARDAKPSAGVQSRGGEK
jgi:protein-disulfide isomerase